MSEKIDQFCEKFHARLKGIEASISKAGETIKATSQEASDDLHQQVNVAKAKLAEIKQESDAKFAALREKIEKGESGVETSVEEHLEKLRQDFDNQLTHLQKSAGDVVTDITGGVIF